MGKRIYPEDMSTLDKKKIINMNYYRAKLKQTCSICDGTYTKYNKKQHDESNKHQICILRNRLLGVRKLIE